MNFGAREKKLWCGQHAEEARYRRGQAVRYISLTDCQKSGGWEWLRIFTCDKTELDL